MSEKNENKTSKKNRKTLISPKRKTIISTTGDEIHKISTEQTNESVVHWMNLNDDQLCENESCSKESKSYCLVCKKRYCQKCATQIHSKSNFHVKYSMSLNDHRKFENINIYCEKHKDNYLEYFKKDTGELFCYECEFKPAECLLIGDAKIFINETLLDSKVGFAKQKKISNEIIQDLDDFDEKLEKLFDNLLKLKEIKKQEILRIKKNMEDTIESISVVEKEMEKDPFNASVFALASIQQKNLKIQNQKTEKIKHNNPLKIYEIIENFLRFSEEKEIKEEIEEDKSKKSTQIDREKLQIDLSLSKESPTTPSPIEHNEEEKRKTFGLKSPRILQNLFPKKKDL